MDIVSFRQLPVLGILRGIEPQTLEPLLQAIESSGLKTIEFTMNTQGAAALIRRARALSQGRLVIGAGTVLDADSLKEALDAGATFIVTPVLVRDVMAYCVKNRIPSFPGALTPTEVYSAWQSGATMVKVFPSGFFGPEYFKELKGPFNEIELLACGGVTPQNMGDYFTAGARAVSFGASVFQKELIAGKDFKKIEVSIRRYVEFFANTPRKGC